MVSDRSCSATSLPSFISPPPPPNPNPKQIIAREFNLSETVFLHEPDDDDSVLIDILYNHSFGTHRRNDSTSSAQSAALSYACHAADGGGAAWARHSVQDTLMDSLVSDFSMVRLGRPGLGDKMFDTSRDQDMPLRAISASPAESVAPRQYENNNRSSYDFNSIMDEERIEDSIRQDWIQVGFICYIRVRLWGR